MPNHSPRSFFWDEPCVILSHNSPEPPGYTPPYLDKIRKFNCCLSKAGYRNRSRRRSSRSQAISPRAWPSPRHTPTPDIIPIPQLILFPSNHSPGYTNFGKRLGDIPTLPNALETGLSLTPLCSPREPRRPPWRPWRAIYQPLDSLFPHFRYDLRLPDEPERPAMIVHRSARCDVSADSAIRFQSRCSFRGG